MLGLLPSRGLVIGLRAVAPCGRGSLISTSIRAFGGWVGGCISPSAPFLNPQATSSRHLSYCWSAIHSRPPLTSEAQSLHRRFSTDDDGDGDGDGDDDDDAYSTLGVARGLSDREYKVRHSARARRDKWRGTHLTQRVACASIADRIFDAREALPPRPQPGRRERDTTLPAPVFGVRPCAPRQSRGLSRVYAVGL